MIAAALKVLGMNGPDGKPAAAVLPDCITAESVELQQNFLEKICLEVVDRYVINEESNLSIKNQQQYLDWLHTCNPQTADGHYGCRLPSCPQSFKSDGKIERNMRRSMVSTQLRLTKVVLCQTTCLGTNVVF